MGAGVAVQFVSTLMLIRPDLINHALTAVNRRLNLGNPISSAGWWRNLEMAHSQSPRILWPGGSPSLTIPNISASNTSGQDQALLGGIRQFADAV